MCSPHNTHFQRVGIGSENTKEPLHLDLFVKGLLLACVRILRIEYISLLPLHEGTAHFCIILPPWLGSLKVAQDMHLKTQTQMCVCSTGSCVYPRWLQKGSCCKCIVLRATSETSPMMWPAHPWSPTQLLCWWKLCFPCAPVNSISCCFSLCAA